MSLRLLREATRAERSKTRKALQAVLDLSEDEEEVLLERTTLGAIVRTGQTIADRSDFLLGLQQLLFSDETRRKFREVDQLHPMLVREPWVFGDEWKLGLPEAGLTKVVEAVTKRQRGRYFAQHPVVLPSGKSGRVDMVFCRYLPDSDRSRHLVVELKRPKMITMVEYGQLNDCATAITSRPEVAGAPHVFDFWLIGTEVNQAVQNLCTDPSQVGLAASTSTYRLWVVSWSQLIDLGQRRVEGSRRALKIESNGQSSREYLERKHAEFIPSDPN